MEYVFSLLATVAAQTISHYMCKALDRLLHKNGNDKHGN